MARYAEDLTGNRYGRLVVIRRDTTKVYGRYRWLCKCDCGGEKLILPHNLKSGATTSCGCKLSAYIGSQNNQSRTPAYRTWVSMMARCYKSSADNYRWYGAKGITVCERWHNFHNFLADMGQPPKGYWIERLDNDGNYTLENCIWESPKQNCANRGGIFA